MVFSLFIVSILSISLNPSFGLQEENNSFLKEEIVELRSDYSSTFLTNRGTFISFYFGESNLLDDTDDDVPTRNNYGQSYINAKTIEIGSSYCDNSQLIVGESQIINPINGTTPVYNSVFELLLPSINTSYYSIRNAGFAFKKQSGQLSSLVAYKVTSPSYSLLDGTSSINKISISTMYLSSFSYDYLNLTNVINDCCSNSNTSLTLLFEGTTHNQTCYLNGLNSSYPPYFYIEYDNYGSARNYYETSGNINCMGYALYENSWLEFTNYVPLGFNSMNLASNFNYSANVIADVLENYGCSNVQNIALYDSLIEQAQRRIAFRFRLNQDGTYGSDFHFMWQTKTGSWAAKLGSGNFVESFNVNAPELDSTWLGYYNSQTYYFAIEKD